MNQDAEAVTRLSTVKGDRGFRPLSEMGVFRVLFNGVQQTDCEVADVTEGYIRRVRVYVNPLTRQPKIVRSGKIFGKVEIQLKD